MIKLRYLNAHKLPLFNSKLYYLMLISRNTLANTYKDSISFPDNRMKVERFFLTDVSSVGILSGYCRDTVVNISLSVTNAYMESISSSPEDSTEVERFYVTKKVNTISLPQHRMKVERLVLHS